MDVSYFLLIISLAAGVVGTGIGGLLGAMVVDKGEKLTGHMLAFAGAVMLGSASFEMLPEAIECFGAPRRESALMAIGAMLAGAAMIGVLGKVVEFVGKKQGINKSGGLALVLAEGTDKKRMLRAGAIMLFAIALHNLPEGMAIGGAGMHERALGVTVAIVIAVHNVPEGMAISAPLAGGGMKAWKAIGLACLAGLATVLGAAIGLAVGGLGSAATGVCLGAAAGAMIYVTFWDVFPEACALLGKFPAASAFAGMACAACFVFFC